MTGPLPAESDHLVRLFPPKPILAERASGASIFAADGTRYVDLGGASQGVANFGHAHPRIVQAIREQAGRLIHVTAPLPSRERAAFLDRLHRLLPSHLERTFLANSGTEAVEAALKFAHAATGRTRLVAARNAFHGRTLGSLAATFKPAYRDPFAALLRPVEFVPFNDEAALEDAVTRETAAVLLEPVQGEGGLTVATPEYLRAAQRIAHERGALLIIDEIQTGLGRTGSDLATDGLGVRPDLMLLGKSLAGGLPIGVAAMTDAVAAAMPPAGHGSTFGGSPLVCAAASAALDVLREERLSARAAELGAKFRSALERLDSPLIRQVRGRGLMLGLDLRIKPQPVLDRLLERRFLALPAGNTVLRFLPPLVIEEEDLRDAASALAFALADSAAAAVVAPRAA